MRKVCLQARGKGSLRVGCLDCGKSCRLLEGEHGANPAAASLAANMAPGADDSAGI